MDVLIIFIKNPEPGKVKTRLAKSVGTQRALEIYKKLINYTLQVAEKIKVKRQIWFSESIPEEYYRKNSKFAFRVQKGKDLGERMSNSFSEAFKDGAAKVVIIGSDCAELSEEHVKNAFQTLDHTDLVLGPAKDGGYYLLGMKEFYPFVFENKEWSTRGLLSSTLWELNKKSLKYYLLEELSDVDEERDLPDWIKI